MAEKKLSPEEVANSVEAMAKSFNRSVQGKDKQKTWGEWMRSFAEYVRVVERERRRGEPD